MIADLPHFADLKPAEKRYWVEVALPVVLAALPGPAPTVVVSGLVARELGCKPDEVGGTVLKLARDHSAARQDGAKFKRYGRTMTGWRWYPQDPLPAPRDPDTGDPEFVIVDDVYYRVIPTQDNFDD